MLLAQANDLIETDLDSKCPICEKELYITDDLMHIQCKNIQCISNLSGRLVKLAQLNNDAIDYQQAMKMVDNWNIERLLEVIPIKKYRQPVSLVDIIQMSCIYLVSNLAKELFTGYTTIKEALNSLTVKEIQSRVNKEYSYEIYKILQEYKEELLSYDDLKIGDIDGL